MRPPDRSRRGPRGGANTVACTRLFREPRSTLNMSCPAHAAEPRTWTIWPGVALPATCANRIESRPLIHPDTGELVPLFNPRRNRWPDHFRWDSHHLVAQTPVGHATLLMLDLNHPRRILIRQAEELFGLFPP